MQKYKSPVYKQYFSIWNNQQVSEIIIIKPMQITQITQIKPNIGFQHFDFLGGGPVKTY